MEEEKVLQINIWRAWDRKDGSFFISKNNETGTIWIRNKEELKDLKELIKRVEKELSQKARKTN